jgi:cell division protease FtsH
MATSLLRSIPLSSSRSTHERTCEAVILVLGHVRRACDAPEPIHSDQKAGESMTEKDFAIPGRQERSMPLSSLEITGEFQHRPASGQPIGPIGPLELAAFRADWRASWRYRRHIAETAAEREHELLVRRLEEEARITAEKAMHGKKSAAAASAKAWKTVAGFINQEQEQSDKEFESFFVKRRAPPPAHPVTPARAAARLIFARPFDSRPDLLEAIRSSAPVVLVEVPDAEMLDRVLASWQETLFPETTRVMKVGTQHSGKRDDYDVVFINAKEPPKAKDKSERNSEALSALSLALPLIAISPAVETHLPDVLLKSRPVRLAFPPLDPVTIARVIRIVTGKRCRELLDVESTARITAADMIVAVRLDRTPAECMAELRRLAADKSGRKSGRDISLDELHGMDEAVAWARSTIRDLQAWRRGEIPWSLLDPGACLVGPPGTGKTLFAQSFARAAGLPLVACSLAQWQSADEAHLGHLLRAMARDFSKARAQPSVLLVDEIDSFADRSKVRHAHADYVVEVVNGFIAQLDGIAGREGLIYLATSNDLSRCDPAILRSGRLNRILRIRPPNVRDLELMFRVRLAGRLAREDLEEICLLALGSTGADVERITNDALRFARHADRALELADLRRALVDREDRNPCEIRRSAIHEAGHVVVEIVHFGHDAHVHASIVRSGNRGGATVRTQAPPFTGTYSDYQCRLQVILAGRTAEEIVLGEASDGAGGSRGSDLQQATALAAAMVASLGLAGPKQLLFLASHDDTDELLSYSDVRVAAHAELMRAAELCRSMLLQHRVALDEVASTLLRTGRIDGVSAAEIIRAYHDV